MFLKENDTWWMVGWEKFHQWCAITSVGLSNSLSGQQHGQFPLTVSVHIGLSYYPPSLPFILCSRHLKSPAPIYIYNKAALHSTVDLQSAPHTGKNIKQALCNCIVMYIKFITSHGSSTKSPPRPPYACQLSWHNPAFSMLPIRSCTFWNWTECIFSLFFLP